MVVRIKTYYKSKMNMSIISDDSCRDLARKMPDRLAEYVRERGIGTLLLETGIHQHEAIRLYRTYGFYEIGPFDEYKPDPRSLFLERKI